MINLLKKVGYRPVYLILAVGMSLLSAVFDGISLGLLIPALNGLLSRGYVSVVNSRFFSLLTSFLFPLFGKTEYNNVEVFITLASAIFVTLLMKNIFAYLSGLALFYYVRQFCMNIRNAVFSRYLSFGRSFFDRVGLGHLNAVLVYFTEDIVTAIARIRAIVQNIFYFLIYTIIMLLISWKLTLFVFVFYPAFNYPINLIIRKIRALSSHYSTSKIVLSQKIANVLSNISLVKACAKENSERRAFQDLSRQVAIAEFSIDKKNLLVGPISEVGFTMLILVGAFFVAFIFMKEEIRSVPSILVFLLILKRCLPLFASFWNFRGELARIQGCIHGINEMFEDKDKGFVPDGSIEFKTMNEKIEFKDLNFSYTGNNQALKGVSFSVEKNKITAIVGKTGSGKTTLIHLLLRFYDCPSRAIFIDGTDIRDFTIKSIVQHIAFVSQETLLFNDTIKNNIIYGVDGPVPDNDLVRVSKRVQLYDYIMGLPQKFDTVIGDRGTKLSGGERQRVSIARALLKNAPILIFDEATSSLDGRTERLIQEAIDALSENRTVIVIAHRLATIKKADKIVVIEEGRVVEQGMLEDLIERKGVFGGYWKEQKFY